MNSSWHNQQSFPSQEDSMLSPHLSLVQDRQNNFSPTRSGKIPPRTTAENKVINLNSLKIDHQINSVAERNAIVSLMDSQYTPLRRREMISPQRHFIFRSRKKAKQEPRLIKPKRVHSSFCMFNDDVVVWLSMVSLPHSRSVRCLFGSAFIFTFFLFFFFDLLFDLHRSALESVFG